MSRPTIRFWEMVRSLSRIFWGAWKQEKGGLADAAFGGAGQIGGAGSILKYVYRTRRKNKQKNKKKHPTTHAFVSPPHR